MPDIEKTSRKLTECICPMCGKKYKRKIFWTGNTIPRKFCSDCKDLDVFEFDHTNYELPKENVFIK